MFSWEAKAPAVRAFGANGPYETPFQMELAVAETKELAVHGYANSWRSDCCEHSVLDAHAQVFNQYGPLDNRMPPVNQKSPAAKQSPDPVDWGAHAPSRVVSGALAGNKKASWSLTV